MGAARQQRNVGGWPAMPFPRNDGDFRKGLQGPIRVIGLSDLMQLNHGLDHTALKHIQQCITTTLCMASRRVRIPRRQDNQLMQLSKQHPKIILWCTLCISEHATIRGVISVGVNSVLFRKIPELLTYKFQARPQTVRIVKPI